MIRMQNDTVIFDQQDLLILFQTFGIEVPEEADVTLSLTCGDAFHQFNWDEACLVVKVASEHKSVANYEPPAVLAMSAG